MVVIFLKNLKYRFPSIFLLLFVFFLPIWTKLAILTIPFLLLSCLVSCDYKNFVKEIKTNRFIQMIYLFWILHLVGILYSENLRYGFNEVQQKLSFIIFPFIAIAIGQNKKIELDKLLKVFLMVVS